MKYIITIILIFFTSVASAQIVNIPDPVFKDYLLHYYLFDIDTNHDGEIQVSEASQVTELQIRNINNSDTISDLTGIREFTNLQTLSIGAMSVVINNLDLSNIPQLKSVGLGSTQINSLNLSNCPNLEYLYCHTPNVANSLSFNLSVDNDRRLKTLDLNFLYIPDLDLRTCDSLSSFITSWEFIRIESLNISGLTHLENLRLDAFIDNVIARNCTGLKTIERGQYDNIYIQNMLDVTGCTNLEKIQFSSVGNGNNPGIGTLDLSTCTNLRILNCVDLNYLNIKNGHYLDSIIVYNSIPGPYTLNVCADDFEVDSVRNMLLRNMNTTTYPYSFPINVSANCSFYPGGTYNTIKGSVKLDMNNNGCDAADAAVAQTPIRISDTSGNVLYRYSNILGNYIDYTYKGIFTLTPYFPYPYFTVNPSPAVVTFDTANSIINTTDFCIRPTGVHNDLEVSFLPLLPARPGFGSVYALNYKNRGTTMLSGNVQLNFDNSKMNFSSAVPVNTTQTTGQLTWNYANLQPFESKTIFVYFYALPSPVNNIGDTLIYLATINPTIGDETPGDNSFILPQRITGSYDPNEKECIEGSNIDITHINDYLHYIIRFQNLGNDTAFNVVVNDTLSNQFDWDSFELVETSHPCHVSRRNNRLEFFFDNIKLPYKAINEPGSNGFVAFKIKPRNSLTIGDSLNNKAAVYFDFNPAVITNVASSVMSPHKASSSVELVYFTAGKNANTGVLEWKVVSGNIYVSFTIEKSIDGLQFNSIGNITATALRCKTAFGFTDNDLSAGKNYYRIKITNTDGISFYSKVLVIEESKKSFELTGITTDQNNTVLHFNSLTQQTVQLKVMSMDGKLIYNGSKIITAGISQVNLQLGNLAHAVYAITVYTSEGELVTKRFMK